ncbi:MAG TPA: ribosome recycling factor [Candidatus Saccharimonadales bacterium]
MDANKVLSGLETKFSEATERFGTDLKSLRTGRANSSMLDTVVVEVYGTTMPMNQVATVSAVDAQLIQITPFDPNNLEAISLSIRNNPSLGLNPSDDGRVIRVPIPALTEERRRELAKQISERLEECMVRLRGVRHDAMDNISKAKKDKEIGEDDAKRLEKQVDEAMSSRRSLLESMAKEKEKEVMTL